MTTNRRFQGIFRITDAAAELDRITAEARAVASAYRQSRDLTPQGRANAFTQDHRRARWAEELTECATRMAGALDKVGNRATSARAKLTAPKVDTQAAILAELRHARRADGYRAAIADNPNNAAQLIADAESAELPALLELLEHTGGASASLVAESVESGLRERSPEYAAAVDATARVAEARAWVAARVDAATAAITGLDDNPHAGGPLAAVSVDALGPLADAEGQALEPPTRTPPLAALAGGGCRHARALNSIAYRAV